MSADYIIKVLRIPDGVVPLTNLALARYAEVFDRYQVKEDAEAAAEELESMGRIAWVEEADHA